MTGPTVASSNIDADEATALLLQGSICWGVDQVAQTRAGCLYEYVKNNHTAAVTQFQTCTYDGTNASGVTAIIRPTTATLTNMAGTVAGANGITNANFGWILIRGVGKIAVDGTGVAITAGDSLKAANASFNAVKDAAQGTNTAFVKYAQAQVASALANSIQANIMCF